MRMSLGHGDDPKLKQLAGFRAHDGDAEDRAVLLGDDLDEAFRFPLALRAVVVGIRPAKNADAPVLAMRFLLGETNLSELRVRIDHPAECSQALTSGFRRNNAFLMTMLA